MACAICGLDYDEIDADTFQIEMALQEKFNIPELEDFAELINHLIPLIDVGSSPITKRNYKGFSNQKGVWFCKVDVETNK